MDNVSKLLLDWQEKKERYDDACQAYFPSGRRERAGRILSEQTLSELVRLEREMKEAHGAYLRALRKQQSERQRAAS